MLHELRRHVVEVLEQVGEDVAVGPQDGILGIHHVQRGGAVEPVNHGLHRVPHVVEAVAQAAVVAELLRVGALAVRILRRGRVGVHDVLHPSLGQHRIRVVVDVQERGQLLDAGAHVADVDHLALVGDEAREQRVHLPEPQREGRLAEEAADLHAALALVGVGRLLTGGGRYVHLLAVGLDDGVTAEFLAVVEPGLIEGDVQVVADRQPADAEVGQPRLHGVGRRQGNPEAMGERERARLPGGLREIAGVQLARPQHDRRHLAVDLVAVHVQHLGELVVVPLALAVLVGQRQDRGIQQRQVADDVLAACDVVVGQPPGGVESADLHVVEPHGEARGGDVVLDVHLLARRLGGLHPQPLDDERVDAAHDDRHEGPEPHRQRGQDPTLEADVHDQQHERKQRDQDEQPMHRQPGVQVGVGGAVHHARRGGRQLVAAQEVVRRLDECEGAQQHRKMRLDLRGDALTLLLEADPAVHVVGDGGDEEGEQDDVEQPVDDVGEERQLEDVEPHVVAEPEGVDGIDGTEVHAVGQQEPFLPLIGGAGADRQSEQQRHAEAHQAGPLPERVVIARQHVLLGAARALGGSHPVGDREVPVEEGEQHCDEDERQHDPGDDDRAPDIGLAQGVEPEEVRVEAGGAAQRHQHDDDRGDGDEKAAPQTAGTDGRGRRSRTARTPRPCHRHGGQPTAGELVCPPPAAPRRRPAPSPRGGPSRPIRSTRSRSSSKSSSKSPRCPRQAADRAGRRGL